MARGTRRNARRVSRWAVVMALALGGCAPATAPGRAADVALTWERRLERRPEAPPPVPVVVFMHGCTGIWTSDTPAWVSFLASHGYAVVAPDSFARPGRLSNCDPRTLTTGRVPDVQRLRYEEIAYALARVRELPWADRDRVFLMGHSEGGVAASLWDRPGFRGVIVSGWPCRARSPHLSGLWTPRGVPVLSIGWAMDPWYRGPGSCQGTRAQVVTLQGIGHATSSSPEAQRAVLAFLDALR